MIYVTGDIHSDIRRFEGDEYKQLTKDDILIILGDFGLTFYPKNATHDYIGQKAKLDKLASYPWTTLTIDGNHENFMELAKLPWVYRYGSNVSEIVKDKIYYLHRGQVYTIEDKTFFTFGGALSIDRAQRLPYISWWPQELQSVEEEKNARANLKRHKFKVDYVLTHTPPKFIIDILNSHASFKISDPVAKFLSAVASEIEFNNFWYSGHMHDEATFVQYPQYLVIYKDLYKLGATTSETGYQLPKLY